jgi:hypothetical protein
MTCVLLPLCAVYKVIRPPMKTGQGLDAIVERRKGIGCPRSHKKANTGTLGRAAITIRGSVRSH